MKSAILYAVALFFAFALSTIAYAANIDFYTSLRPQSYTNTCQSYGLALTAGTMAGSPIPVGTAEELRDSELELRRFINAVAEEKASLIVDPVKRDEARRDLPYSHEVWKEALSRATSGTLQLNIKFVKGIEPFYSLVERLTGNANAEISPALSLVLARTPVLTSVVKMGNDTYASGHIVTLYGVSSANPLVSEARSLLVLNPAIKLRDANRIACDMNDLPGDTRYSALLSLEPNYRLKAYDDALLVMWVSPARRSEGAAANELKRNLFVSQFVKDAVRDPNAAAMVSKAIVGIDPNVALARINPVGTASDLPAIARSIKHPNPQEAAVEILYRVSMAGADPGLTPDDTVAAERAALRAAPSALEDVARAAFDLVNAPQTDADELKKQRILTSLDAAVSLPSPTDALDTMLSSFDAASPTLKVAGALRDMSPIEYTATVLDDRRLREVVQAAVGPLDEQTQKAFAFVEAVDSKAGEVMDAYAQAQTVGTTVARIQEAIDKGHALDLSASDMRENGQAVAALVGVIDPELGKNIAQAVDAGITMATAATDLANGLSAAATGNYVGAALSMVKVLGNQPDPASVMHQQVMAALGRIEAKLDRLMERVAVIDKKLDLVRDDLRDLRVDMQANFAEVTARLGLIQKSIQVTQAMLSQGFIDLILDTKAPQAEACRSGFPAFVAVRQDFLDVANPMNELTQCLSLFKSIALDTSSLNTVTGRNPIATIFDSDSASGLSGDLSSGGRGDVSSGGRGIDFAVSMMPQVVDYLGLANAVKERFRAEYDPALDWVQLTNVNGIIWLYGVSEYVQLLQRVPAFPVERHPSTVNVLNDLRQPGKALQTLSQVLADERADELAVTRYRDAATALLLRLKSMATDFSAADPKLSDAELMMGFVSRCESDACPINLADFQNAASHAEKLKLTSEKVSAPPSFDVRHWSCHTRHQDYLLQPPTAVTTVEMVLSSTNEVLARWTVTSDDHTALIRAVAFQGGGRPRSGCPSLPRRLVVDDPQRYAAMRNDIASKHAREPSWTDGNISGTSTVEFFPDKLGSIRVALEGQINNDLVQFLLETSTRIGEFRNEVSELNAAYISVQLATRLRYGDCMSIRPEFASLVGSIPAGADFERLVDDREPIKLGKMRQFVSGLLLAGVPEITESYPLFNEANLSREDTQNKLFALYGETYSKEANPENWNGCHVGLGSVNRGLAWLDGFETVRQVLAQAR